MSSGRYSILISYLFVGFLAVGFAFLVSMKFLGSAYSQEATSADVPEAATPAVKPTTEEVENLQGFLEPFLYDANNRRDPFQPFVEYREEKLQAPVQKFDVDDFKLVGIMWDINDPKAMFVDPENKVHIVSRDESIGRRNGYIAAIREGEVVVVESQRKQGDIVYKTKVVKISR